MQGESVAIIGRSGTGKSVLLKCILGLTSQDSGTIKINGHNVSKSRKKVLPNIGVLFQNSALLSELPVWENIAFSLIHQDKVSRRDAQETAETLLPHVGLPTNVSTQMPARLSVGMQKRVGLARAIINKPDFLFFDEPTSGLDPISANLINNLIRDQVNQLGATSITITHDMNNIHKITNRIIMLHEGSIIWSGLTSELHNTDNPYVQKFITAHNDDNSYGFQGKEST